MRKNAPAYARAGVRFENVDRLIQKALPYIRSTRRSGVIKGTGRFAGVFKHKGDYWVSSTDGVGTKLKYAFAVDRHEEVGIDCVAMNVNDIVTKGAEPLFFLSYIATGKVREKSLLPLLRGISRGCREAGCALISGETAEMPGFFPDGKYDVAGFAVGVTEAKKFIGNRKIARGDLIVGLASNGLHSNGFSLVRKIFPENRTSRTVMKRLLRPTRIYVKPILALRKRFPLKAVVHITGGGLYNRLFENIPRKRHLILYKKSWPVPSIFLEIEKRAKQRRIKLTRKDMSEIFNMGIGMAVVCRAKDVAGIQRILKRFRIPSWVIGEVVA